MENTEKKVVPAEVSVYMSQIGKKGGDATKKKGKKYFAGIVQKRKWRTPKK